MTGWQQKSAVRGIRVSCVCACVCFQVYTHRFRSFQDSLKVIVNMPSDVLEFANLTPQILLVVPWLCGNSVDPLFKATDDGHWLLYHGIQDHGVAPGMNN